MSGWEVGLLKRILSFASLVLRELIAKFVHKGGLLSPTTSALSLIRLKPLDEEHKMSCWRQQIAKAGGRPLLSGPGSVV